MDTFTFHAEAYHTEGLDHKKLWTYSVTLEVSNEEDAIEVCLAELQRVKKIHPEVAKSLVPNENQTDSEYTGYECLLMYVENSLYSLYIDYKDDGNDNQV